MRTCSIRTRQTETLEKRLLWSVAFSAPQTFPAPGAPYHIVAADVNGDGRPDLVIGNGYHHLEVLLGTGSGSFSAPLTNSTDDVGTSGLSVADVNHDGRPDVLTSNNATSVVQVFLGNGNGAFQAPLSFNADGASGAPQVFDANGDGIPDLLVADSNTENALLFPGNGDGTFQPALSVNVGLQATNIVTADLNGDGKADLSSYSRYSTTVSLVLGTGGGTFGTPLSEDLPGVNQVSIADLNGDNQPDIVASSSANGGTVDVFINAGSGTSGTPVVYPLGFVPNSVQIADMGGSDGQNTGVPDIVAASGDQFVVLVGNGDGTFHAATTFPTGDAIRRFALADVNGDGRPDFIGASYENSNVVVLLNQDASAIQPVNINNGILTITGTPNADTIASVISGTSFSVLVTGQSSQSYPFNTVRLINVLALAGSDSVTLAGIPISCSMVGAGGADTLLGGAAADTIFGNSGDDYLGGAAGNDVVAGGKGNNIVRGGKGNDTLAAGLGNSNFHGGKGNDSITGTAGVDTLNGNNGNDTIVAGSGMQKLAGGPGNDSLVGAILAGDGPDTVFSYYGSDVIHLGANDSLIGQTAGDTVSRG